MSMAYFAGIPGKIKVLLDRVTATRAANLDKLDATVSTRSTSTEVAKAATWTQALADKINLNLDKKVSESGLVKKRVVLTATTASNWTIPPKLKHGGVEVSMIGGGGSGSKQIGTGQAGGGGQACQSSWYSFSGAEVTAGQIAYQCGVGGAAKTTSGNGNDGSPTTFGSWSVAGGEGGDALGGGNRSGTRGAFESSTDKGAAQSYSGKYGALAGSTFENFLAGGGGLRFSPVSPTFSGLSPYDGDGYGAGSFAHVNNLSSGAGKQGAILLEWEETP